MIHRPRFHPPPHIYPPDEWNLIEKRFMPDLLEQDETMFALGNGYLGMRGCFEEGGPIGQNGTFINGVYESWPIIYPEDAYGFASTGQTIVNVTDSKNIKLYVDDEPFWLPHANVRSFDRRLNMKSGTLDRDVIWETPGGKQVSIRSRRLVSFENGVEVPILAFLNADNEEVEPEEADHFDFGTEEFGYGHAPFTYDDQVREAC